MDADEKAGQVVVPSSEMHVSDMVTDVAAASEAVCLWWFNLPCRVLRFP